MELKPTPSCLKWTADGELSPVDKTHVIESLASHMEIADALTLMQVIAVPMGIESHG